MKQTQPSQLEKAVKHFDECLQELQKADGNKEYCLNQQNCQDKDKCEKEGICIIVLNKLDIASLNYKHVLDIMEREYGGIPKEQSDNYIRDTDSSLYILHQINRNIEKRDKKQSKVIIETALKIATRRKIVREKLYHY